MNESHHYMSCAALTRQQDRLENPKKILKHRKANPLPLPRQKKFRERKPKHLSFKQYCQKHGWAKVEGEWIQFN